MTTDSIQVTETYATDTIALQEPHAGVSSQLHMPSWQVLVVGMAGVFVFMVLLVLLTNWIGKLKAWWTANHVNKEP